MDSSVPAVILPQTTEFINTLNEFGLKEEWFGEIGQRILGEYNRATPHDAVIAGGLYAYLGGVRATRDILTRHGFKFLSENNIESTHRPSDNFKIIISSGCSDTGRKNGNPKTKNPKGTQLKRFIFHNPKQILIPGIVLKLRPEDIRILLFHIDVKNEEFRMELSQPYQMEINGEKERVERWHHRIIFTPIKMNPEPIGRHPEFTSEFDIDITRIINE